MDNLDGVGCYNGVFPCGDYFSKERFDGPPVRTGSLLYGCKVVLTVLKKSTHCADQLAARVVKDFERFIYVDSAH